MTVTPEQDTGDRSEALTFEAGGVDEVSVVPWPLMLHRRIARRLGARTTPSPWLVLVVALAGLFTVSFTITLLTVSLKTIARDLHSSDTTLTWVITGPMLAFGVVGPALGKAGDLWGHKRLFLISLGGAAIFAVLTALSWNALSLIVFRVIGAGIGSATGPASMAMIARVLSVMFFSIALGDRLYVRGSRSVKTGIAPCHMTGRIVPMSVIGGTITSSPGDTPPAMQAACSAAVPLLHAMPNFPPCFCAKACSSALTFLPCA